MKIKPLIRDSSYDELEGSMKPSTNEEIEMKTIPHDENLPNNTEEHSKSIGN